MECCHLDSGRRGRAFSMVDLRDHPRVLGFPYIEDKTKLTLYTFLFLSSAKLTILYFRVENKNRDDFPEPNYFFAS